MNALELFVFSIWIRVVYFKLCLLYTHALENIDGLQDLDTNFKLIE